MLHCFSLRGHNCAAGSEQWQSSLPRHQPVHNGWPCDLHGISYGHPQQHHALRELRLRARPLHVRFSKHPLYPLQTNSQIQKTKTSAPVFDHHFIFSLSLHAYIYRYTCILICIYSKISFTGVLFLHIRPAAL